MGNGCSCDWAKDAWDSFKGFFEELGKWIANEAEYLWGDAKWAYYITKDLLLVAGPFLGFFLYSMLTRGEIIIQR